MFTGIVQGTGVIESIHNENGLRAFQIKFPDGFCDGLLIGASVSIDGTCLTVVEILNSQTAIFDVMLQTLNITTLGGYKPHQRVNVERSAKDGAEIGGHILSGHVDFMARVDNVTVMDGNKVIRFSVPPKFMKYIFSKGYIAVNGTSLTLAEVNKEENWFEVWLIPETRRVTVFEEKAAGDFVNIEIDRNTQIMVDTIRDTVREMMAKGI